MLAVGRGSAYCLALRHCSNWRIPAQAKATTAKLASNARAPALTRLVGRRCTALQQEAAADGRQQDDPAQESEARLLPQRRRAVSRAGHRVVGARLGRRRVARRHDRGRGRRGRRRGGRRGRRGRHRSRGHRLRGRRRGRRASGHLLRPDEVVARLEVTAADRLRSLRVQAEVERLVGVDRCGVDEDRLDVGLVTAVLPPVPLVTDTVDNDAFTDGSAVDGGLRLDTAADQGRVAGGDVAGRRRRHRCGALVDTRLRVESGRVGHDDHRPALGVGELLSDRDGAVVAEERAVGDVDRVLAGLQALVDAGGADVLAHVRLARRRRRGGHAPDLRVRGHVATVGPVLEGVVRGEHTVVEHALHGGGVLVEVRLVAPDREGPDLVEASLERLLVERHALHQVLVVRLDGLVAGKPPDRDDELVSRRRVGRQRERCGHRACDQSDGDGADAGEDLPALAVGSGVDARGVGQRISHCTHILARRGLYCVATPFSVTTGLAGYR